MTEIIHGDCLEEMSKMGANSISCIVTDPPYGLKFMGKDWDHGIPGVAFWKEALRVCKPGSHLLSFGGTRTHHRLTCAIEDAGWEIRDCLFWCYAQGFPKSHNFGCKCTGDAVPYNHEKITQSNSESCMRSLPETDLSSSFSACTTENEAMFKIMQEQGLQNDGAMSFQGLETGKESSVEGGNHIQKEQRELYRPQVCEVSNGIHGNGKEGWLCNGTPSSDGEASEQAIKASGSSSPQRSQHKEQQHRKSGTVSRQSDSQDCGMGTCQKCGGLIAFKGYGTALKPAYEPIIVAMKPCDGTFKNNAEKWGQAGINIDGCRVGIEERFNPPTTKGKTAALGSFENCHGNGSIVKGRWPANVLFDEEAARMLDEQSGTLTSGKPGCRKKDWVGYQTGLKTLDRESGFGDSGGASRFFYCAKASSSERGESNRHPTVKPLKLMEYLIKLVMPPKDGLLLDPFAGSGTTILAAKRLGFNAIGIEKCEEYSKIARARSA